MNTRTLLAGFFVVALVGSAVVGTGAGDIFGDQDGVEESVTLSPADTPEGTAYASTNDAGELSVTIDGLPRNAQTDVDDVFEVSFDSPTSPTANVLIEEGESNDNVDFVVTDASNAAGVQSNADIDDSRVELESGESVLVGVELDGTSEGSVEISEITADVELDAGDIDEVDVTFDNNVIAEDDGETQATATAVFQDGPTQDRTDQATFESNDTDVAEVTDGGAITAGEAGTAEITATLPEENGDGTVTGSAVINVGLITALDVELADDRVRFGSGVNPTETTSVDSVTATLADGSTTDVTNDTDLTVTPFTSSDAELVDVNDDLTITPTEDATGTATIQAELQGETATDDVTVSRVVSGDIDANDDAEFDDADRIEGISFVPDEGEDLEGESVSVEESDRPGEDVEQEIEQEIVDPDPTAADFEPATSVDVTVPDEATDNTATITLTSPIEEVVDPDNPIVVRVPDGEDPVALSDENVTVIEETDETITVEAETPGFSTFVLGGTTAPEPSGGGGGGGVTGVGGGGVTSTAGQAKTISDVRPADPGTTVAFEQTALTAITFEAENAEGTVGVDQLDGVPGGAPPFSPSRPVAAAFEIDVPDEQAEQSATLEFELDADAFDSAGLDPAEATVLRALDEEYEQLDPDIEVDGDTVTITVETPGFSTFVVTDDQTADADAGTETPAPDDDGTPVPGDGTPATDDDATETPEPEATETPEPEGQPGFGAGLALVALLAAALLAARRQADG
ncbi:PGF-CTERM sorting domain-containing protein [Natronomonas sp. LN261]|uniref:PGF-CTERM sorting domain-containing protein n=1 Tax=Natronomonas sp. LN261 TaxID=2750669 RepID=UPI0015EF9936|nr:PGF-CTERM sorting domain-containing protein [Natronomonas sp. LN261]